MDDKKTRSKWRAKRMYKDITLREVAKEANSSYSSVAKWERNERNINSDTIDKYKKYIENKKVDFE